MNKELVEDVRVYFAGLKNDVSQADTSTFVVLLLRINYVYKCAAVLEYSLNFVVHLVSGRKVNHGELDVVIISNGLRLVSLSLC